MRHYKILILLAICIFSYFYTKKREVFENIFNKKDVLESEIITKKKKVKKELSVVEVEKTMVLGTENSESHVNNPPAETQRNSQIETIEPEDESQRSDFNKIAYCSSFVKDCLEKFLFFNYPSADNPKTDQKEMTKTVCYTKPANCIATPQRIITIEQYNTIVDEYREDKKNLEELDKQQSEQNRNPSSEDQTVNYLNKLKNYCELSPDPMSIPECVELQNYLHSIESN